MKRWRVAATLLFVVVLLSSCNTSNDRDDFYENYIPKADEYYDETIPGSPEHSSAIVVRYVEPFSSGRAWINYRYEDEDKNTRHTGCIDSTGKLIFSFEPEIAFSSLSPFENGAAYGKYNGATYIINDQGDVLTSSIDGQFESIISHGDGYFLAYKNKEGFDSDEYLFLIIDHTGEVVKEISSKECTDVPWETFKESAYSGTGNAIARYCGEGIFQFEKSSDLCLFYDLKRDIFYEKECTISQRTKVNDGMCILDVDGKYVLFDVTNQTDNFDQIEQLSSSIMDEYVDFAQYHARYNCGPISNGKVIYYFYSNYESHYNEPLYGCFWADKTGIYPITAYSEYLNVEHSCPLSFDSTSDRILLRFMGKDSNYYLSIIDSDGNTIMEPMKCDKRSSEYFSCGRFCAVTENDTQIYDTGGNLIFSLSDVGGESIDEFFDGIALIDRNKESAKAVDVNGQILFDNIDATNVKQVTLRQD